MKNLKADLVLLDGKIVTVDEDFSIKEAVAVREGRFLAVGVNKEIKPLIGPKTKVLDLKGKMVIPGLTDGHCHPISLGRVLEQLPLFGVYSISRMTARLRKKVEATEPGRWIIGKAEAWEPETLKEKRLPTKQDLDETALKNPVLISAYSSLGQISVVNSYTLKLAGIKKDTPDPNGGRIERKTVTGEPTGVLYNTARELVWNKISQPFSEEEVKAAVKRAQRAFVEVGVTSVFDAHTDLQEIKAYQSLAKRGELYLRVSLLPEWKVFTSCPDILTETRSERLKIVGIKLMADGGVMFRTASMHGPYLGQPENRGRLYTEPEELRRFVYEVHSQEKPVGIHCTGDHGQDISVDAIVDALKRKPREDSRHSIIHGYFPTSNSLKKMRKHGILYMAQPRFLHCWGESLLKIVGPERANRFKPLRTYIDSGIKVVGGSDAPVVDPNPFLGMHAAVTRKTVTGRVLGPEERVSIEEAIRMYTIDGAAATFEEDIKGSIEKGKLADLAVLDKDLLTIPPDKVKNIKVVMTMIGGEIVYPRSA